MPAPERGAAPRQLLVDVSVIARHDAGTGIQRVVRGILLQLLREPPAGCEIRPVRAGRWRGYRYEDAYAAAILGRPPVAAAPRRVAVRPGDMFVALDLAPGILPRHWLQLAGWKRRGATIHFVVHDLLPVLEPAWFTRRAVRRYRRWMRALVALGDAALCTSRCGARELAEWLAAQYPGLRPPLSIEWFHLGADIEASAPSAGLPAGFERDLARLRGATTILMVGTIEPRKAHAQVLSAFELLWRAGHEVNLVLAGQPGWKSAKLAARIRRESRRGARLHWFESVSDEALAALYRAADGVLVASYAEGFGLPLVEAARHGRPLLARDIPVFRELAGGHARLFTGEAPEDLAATLTAWLADLRAGRAATSTAMQWSSWRDSARQLARRLGL